MQQRALGNTGLTVSCLGLGTVKFGRTQQVKYPGAFTLPDDDQVRDILDLALDLGITLLDTAPAYGTSEERLGRLLGPRRDRFCIVTKAGEEFSDGRSRFDFSPGAIRASVERSLARLRTDRLECVLLHSDGRDEWILRQSGAVDALEDLKSEGKVRTIGISAKSPQGLLCALDRCDVVMATLHPGYLDELDAIRAAQARGVGVLVKKALASGHLGSEGVEASLRLCLSEAGVSSVVIGSITPAHIRQNAEIAHQVCAEGLS